MSQCVEIGPQPGPQAQFQATQADIAIYGGSAGGGKTFAMLMEPVRHYHRPNFRGIIFRRTKTQVQNTGGLWDESCKLYPHLSAIPYRSALVWRFPSGGQLQFSALEREKDKFNFQGNQIPFIGFEELTHFTEGMFWYMLSRNRGPDAGFRPYLRATCNPDPDHFVARLVSWYIGDDGYAIPERSGVVRWFVRVGDELDWAASREELLQRHGLDELPMSFTFIRSSIFDNPALLKANPGYLASLKALPRVDRMRLLGEEAKGGNWLIRASAGDYFRASYFSVVDAPPATFKSVIRYWDRAATEPSSENPDPDWTVGLKLGLTEANVAFVLDVQRFQATSFSVEERMRAIASQDGKSVRIGVEQDPGQAGKSEANYLVRALAGYDVRVYPATKDKETRAKPVSSQAEAGNVKIVRGKWNDAFLRELENFPKGEHDDQVDALSGAYNALTGGLDRILVS